MRCFFNLVNGEQTLLDETGVEVTNVGVARSQALAAIMDLQRDDADGCDDWDGWRLDVVDTAGRTLLSFDLAACLPARVEPARRRMMN